MWDMHALCEAAANALKDAGDALDAEQAVRGLDALDELAIHPILARGLRDSGWGVLREQPYPGDTEKVRRRSARERCDLVVLPSPGHRLIDPIEALIAAHAREATLFASVEPESDPLAIGPDEACWIEVKVVGQYCFRDGVPVPNSSYSSELTSALTEDLSKVSRDPALRHSAVMLVLFTQDEAIAEHDVTMALHRAIDRAVPFRAPMTRRLAVRELIGNAVCSVVLVPGGSA